MNHSGPSKSQRPVAKPRLLPGLAVKDGLIRHPFDLEFGTRTSGLIAGRHLNAGYRNDRHVTAYYAIAPSVFEGILVRWRRCRPLAPIDSYTFIDFGAGMGRALLLAATYPFRAVFGVESHPALARIARRNLALWRDAGRIRGLAHVYCRDAASFPLPSGPCLAFLFNPFGAPVLRRMLRHWKLTSNDRSGPVDILYVNDEQRNVLACDPGCERLYRGQIRRSQADAAADRKILLNQPGAEYAAPAWEDCSIYRWKGRK